MRGAIPEIILTARLRLRPWQLDDAGDVFMYASDEEWSRYLPVPRPYTKTHAEEFVARQVLLDRSLHGAWAAELDGVVVGGLDLGLVAEHCRATMGWAIAKWVWGQGLASEAASAVIHAAFNALPDLNRISASADSRNLGSLRVMEKVGMQREGFFRQHRRSGGEFTDEVWCAILRDEWLASRSDGDRR